MVTALGSERSSSASRRSGLWLLRRGPPAVRRGWLFDEKKEKTLIARHSLVQCPGRDSQHSQSRLVRREASARQSREVKQERRSRQEAARSWVSANLGKRFTRIAEAAN